MVLSGHCERADGLGQSVDTQPGSLFSKDASGDQIAEQSAREEPEPRASGFLLTGRARPARYVPALFPTENTR